MSIRYRLDLSEAERVALEALLRGGRHVARKLKRPQILLAADAGMPDDAIAQSLMVPSWLRGPRQIEQGASVQVRCAPMIRDAMNFGSSIRMKQERVIAGTKDRARASLPHLPILVARGRPR